MRNVVTFLGVLGFCVTGIASAADLKCELRKEVRTGYFELVEAVNGISGQYNPAEKIAVVKLGDSVTVSGHYVAGQLTVGAGRDEDVLTKPTRDFNVYTTTLEDAAQVRFSFSSALGYDMGTHLFTCTVSTPE